jgi:glycosyltransferase involved in cell wall biosynthesis
MKILFITRNFPPQRGGLGIVAFQLYSYLKKDIDVTLLKWGGSRKLLFLILPYFLMRAFWVLLIRRVNAVYLNEGFLSILGVILKLFKVPIIITIHGLDITYKNRFYQLVIPRCISRLDKIACISRATKEECVKRGIPEYKIRIIPDGFRDEFYIDEDKKKLSEEFTRKVGFKVGNNKNILLSVCRLIERKGIHWFVDKVIPLLIDDYRDFVYIVVGNGFMRKRIENIIDEKNLHDWVILLGSVDDELLRLLYNISDIFVMPNIPVKGDIEGFGVVALEASSCKLPVIASDLEGIKDALLDGKIGSLVDSLDALKFSRRIIEFLKNDNLRESVGEEARRLVIDNFIWEKIAKMYLNIFGDVKTK